MHAQVVLCINQHTKFEVPRITNSKDIIVAKFKKRVTWPWPRQLKGNLLSEGVDIFHMYTKFGNFRFSRSGDMIAGVEIENGPCYPGHDL